MYLLFDCDAYYCSVHSIFEPSLRRLPLVTLSSNDGSVIALNRKAKELGLKRGDPYFKVKPFCDRHSVQIRSSNFPLYVDISDRVMTTISRFVPSNFVYSIDEIFGDIRNTSKAIPDVREYCLNIRKTVYRECKIPICVGGASTLTLSKLANKYAKNHQPRSKGVCIIKTEHERIELLKQAPIDSVWGIGKKLSSKLRIMGLRTAFDLSQLDTAVAQRQFSIEMVRVVNELKGIPSKFWDDEAPDQKQIYSTSTLGERVFDIDSIQQALCKHVSIAARKARDRKLLCKTVVCYIRNSPFDPYPVTHRAIHEFDYATSDTTTISNIVTRLAEKIFHEDVAYCKVGVGLIELYSSKHAQLDMLNPEPDDTRLMNVLDSLNNRYGTDCVFVAGQGIQQKWVSRREYLSPEFTTKWRDIPIVKA